MARGKNKQKDKGNNTPALKGKLEVVRTGMGFVKVEGLERDILIHPERLNTALSGDEVQVEITKESKGGRQEGRITEVLSRKQNEFSGRLEVKEHFAFLIPDKQNMPVDIFIPLHLLHDGKNGDKAIVKIVEWTPKAKNPIGEVTSILTNETVNESAMQGILIDAGFPLQFPDDVLEEAARFTDVIDKSELKRRKDLRGLLAITIDPVDARDFDDALSFRKLKGGNYEIGVHIADVSHFVAKDSALDKEAYLRATSVYLPDRVNPMLPTCSAPCGPMKINMPSRRSSRSRRLAR
jgi:ribonuclease R